MIPGMCTCPGCAHRAMRGTVLGGGRRSALRLRDLRCALLGARAGSVLRLAAPPSGSPAHPGTHAAAAGARGAPRTACSSLLSSLRFLEEAVEVAHQDRLSSEPSLDNAVKELGFAAAEAATYGRLRAGGLGRKAPPLPTGLCGFPLLSPLVGFAVGRHLCPRRLG